MSIETKRKNKEDHASYSDQHLMTALQAAVHRERKATQDVLDLLREVQRRQLHLKRGYSSLFTFLTQECHYSEGAAQRRVMALRLINDLGPEWGKKVENDLQSGELSLATLCSAQSAFHKDQSLSAQGKVGLLDELKGKTRDEVQRKIAEALPAAATAIPPERKKIISAELTELRVYVDPKTLEQLNELQLLLSHSLKDPKSYSELFTRLASIVLDKLDPAQKIEQRTRRQRDATTNAATATSTKQNSVTQQRPRANQRQQQSSVLGSKKASRYIPASIRQAVMDRDGHCCSYHDPLTGRICGSRFKLELDHEHPFALGGENTVLNLRVRCQSHNRLHAMESFGSQTMNQFTIARR